MLPVSLEYWLVLQRWHWSLLGLSRYVTWYLFRMVVEGGDGKKVGREQTNTYLMLTTTVDDGNPRPNE